MELLKGVDVSALIPPVCIFQYIASIPCCVRNSLESGVPIQGVYNYSYATTVQKAIGDAQAVLHILGSERHPMVWLDWELPWPLHPRCPGSRE